MIPVLIGAAVAGVASYKILGKERHDQVLQEETSTRIISESEVPPDVLEKIRQKKSIRLAKETLKKF